MEIILIILIIAAIIFVAFEEKMDMIHGNWRKTLLLRFKIWWNVWRGKYR
jgi:hypothetical protein